jgi:hypothetical protein
MTCAALIDGEITPQGHHGSSAPDLQVCAGSQPASIRPQHQKQFRDMEIWNALLTDIAAGKSFTSALKDRPGAPSYAVAKRYLRDDATLLAAYRVAQHDRADLLAEELLELADAPIPQELDGAARAAWVAHTRLRLDIRRYLASKLFPRQWGERLAVDVDVSQRISITSALALADSRLLGATATSVAQKLGESC